jgi:GntR family transcriptional regulator, transcriptional repressor for pyruvate dehydrogenase complex
LSDNLTGAPIARRKTYELVADRLLELITAHRIQPGDPLPVERELVEGFEVGRSSVREALRMLESRGLIESRGRGTFTVSEFRNPLYESLGLLLSVDEADERELFELRRILEGETAALAAARRDSEHLEQMAAAIEEMQHGLDNEQTYIAADLSFHLTIAEACGNRLASHLMYAIRGQVQKALGTAFLVPGGPRRSLGQHRAILEAIEARRPREAREVMQEHIQRVEDEMRRLGARRT